MKNGWITKRIAEGDSDATIVRALVDGGWNEHDAKRAVAEARRPALLERIPTPYAITFFTALAGLFALIAYSNAYGVRADIYTSPFMIALEACLSAVFVVLSLVFLAGVAYDIAIKHHHPRLHGAFYAIAGGTVGIGIASWFLLMTVLILQWTRAVMYTVAAILILCIAFGIMVAVLEAVYSALREHYDARPRSSTTRMLIIAGACATVMFALLLAVVALAERSLEDDVRERMVEMRLRYDEATRPTQLMAEDIENPYLRREVLAHLEHPRLPARPKLSMHDVVTDVAMERVIEGVYGMAYEGVDITTALTLTKAYEEFKQTPEAERQYDLASYAVLRTPVQSHTIDIGLESAMETSLLGIQWKPLVEAGAIQDNLERYMDRMDAYTDFFPANPDMADPDQAELVAFRIWLHEQELARNIAAQEE